jgi:hypothetical protein
MGVLKELNLNPTNENLGKDRSKIQNNRFLQEIAGVYKLRNTEAHACRSWSRGVLFENINDVMVTILFCISIHKRDIQKNLAVTSISPLASVGIDKYMGELITYFKYKMRKYIDLNGEENLDIVNRFVVETNSDDSNEESADEDSDTEDSDEDSDTEDSDEDDEEDDEEDSDTEDSDEDDEEDDEEDSDTEDSDEDDEEDSDTEDSDEDDDEDDDKDDEEDKFKLEISSSNKKIVDYIPELCKKFGSKLSITISGIDSDDDEGRFAATIICQDEETFNEVQEDETIKAAVNGELNESIKYTPNTVGAVVKLLNKSDPNDFLFIRLAPNMKQCMIYDIDRSIAANGQSTTYLEIAIGNPNK